MLGKDECCQLAGKTTDWPYDPFHLNVKADKADQVDQVDQVDKVDKVDKITLFRLEELEI